MSVLIVWAVPTLILLYRHPEWITTQRKAYHGKHTRN